MKYILIISFFILMNSAYSKSLDMSQTTIDSIKSVFGAGDIVFSNKINIKLIKNLLPFKSEVQYIEGANVNIQFGYRGNVKNTQLIGVFIDGNKEPLVASIIPKQSISKDPFYFNLRGKAENDCYGKYKVIVVIKERNKIIANILPFVTFVSDCTEQ